MKKLRILTLALAAPAALVAGDWGKEVVDPVCAVPFTGSVSVGYESLYMFRGIDYGGDAPWMGIDLSIPVLGSSIDLGAWYINPTDERNSANDANDELDLYASMSRSFGGVNVTSGVIFYSFPEAGAADGTRDFEKFISLAYAVGDLIDVTWSTYYSLNFNADRQFASVQGDGAWFHDLNFSKGMALTDCLPAGLSFGLGFSDNYNTNANDGTAYSGLNHYYTTLGLTYALTEAAALDMYLGGSFADDDVAGNFSATQGDVLHGGASISVSF
ncbi:MAG: TorF family putative porin [Verrucomicrobiota bacterium]